MSRFAIESRRAAYVAMAVLTLIWGGNWAVMKLSLQQADPIPYNLHRTLIAVVALFALLVWQRRSLWPDSWLAVIVVGFFQTTLNFGATTMALAEGGAGRTSVLVFTMPFWTVLIAWPVLGERLRGWQWLAVALVFVGLLLIVEPWNWQGSLAPRLWAVLSGVGWAAGTIAVKYYQRDHRFDMVNLMAWQMLIGILLFVPMAWVHPSGPTRWDGTYLTLLFYTGLISSAFGFVLWVAILRWLSAGIASLNTLFIPVIALSSSMLLFGERLTTLEWLGIALLGGGLVLLSLVSWRAGRGNDKAADSPNAGPPLIEGS